MKNNILLPVYSTVILLFWILLPFQLLAYTFTPEIGIDVRNESNVTKDATETEDTVIAPYLDIKFAESNATINANVDFFAEYEDYRDDTFSANDLYEVNAFLDWILLPERLVWAFEDFATTQRVDVQDTEIPDNLQTVNVFSTGPDLSYQQTVWTWLAKFRAGDSSYTTSNADSTFYSLTGAVRRDINEYSRVTAALAHRQSDFDAQFLDDYDVNKAFISYSRDLPTGDFLADFGFNSVEFDRGNDEDKPYLKLLTSIQPTGSLTLDLYLADEITDSVGRAYNATESRIVETVEEVDQFSTLSDFTSTGIYRAQDASLGVRYAAGRLSLGLSGSSADKDYINDRADSDDIIGRAYANLQLTSLLTVGIGGSYQEVDFDESTNFPAISDEITRGYGVLNYRITENITTRLGYSTQERTSSDITRDYTNDIVFFTLKYKGAVK